MQQTSDDSSRLPVLLFDIGGTNTRMGVSFDGSTISKTEIFKTPRSYEEGLQKLSTVAGELLENQKAKVAVGGIAGPLTRNRQATASAPHLASWAGRPLALELSASLGCEVYLENDTAMAALGEAVFGSGKEKHIVAYMTLSTGVNGAKVVGGVLEPSYQGFEIGHQIIDMDGARYAELEQFISGSALEKRYGLPPHEISDPAVWDEVAKHTAVGVYNTILYWSPEIIVLGGSLTKKLSLEKVKLYLKPLFNLTIDMPVIAKYELGDFGGLWGALHYANTLPQKSSGQETPLAGEM